MFPQLHAVEGAVHVFIRLRGLQSSLEIITSSITP